MRSITQTQGAPAELAKLLPNSATRVVGDGSDERIEEVPLSALGDGYVVLVRPGASAPASGATGLSVAPRALPLTGSMVDVIRRRCALTPVAARSGRFRADRSEQCVVVTPAATAGRCRPPPQHSYEGSEGSPGGCHLNAASGRPFIDGQVRCLRRIQIA
jgi:hypothetical protein